jgi:lysozyme
VTSSRRARGVVLAALALAAAAAWWRAGWLSWVRRDHLIGVDVSHHQGPIVWSDVRAAGISFAFIKATEGVTFTDPAFAEHWRGAARAGVVRGAYHFFTFCTSGRAQADHFVAVVPVEAGALPPLVDLELGGNCATRPSVARLEGELGDFLGVVEQRYGLRAILYVTEDFQAQYGAVTEGRALFVRELFTRPGWLAGRPWLFWQFHDGGHIEGIDGAVDLDAFGGSLDELFRLRGGVETPDRVVPRP